MAERIKLGSRLDETTDFERIAAELNRAHKKAGSDPIEIDWAKVQRTNSFGIRLWLGTLEGFSGKTHLLRVPVTILEQLSLLPSHLRTHVLVRSAMLPFYCETTDDVQLFEWTVGKEIPILQNYEHFDGEFSTPDGETFVMDSLPDIFSFIAEDYDRYSIEFGQNRAS